MERPIILAIILSAMATAVMRTLPILLLSRFSLPGPVQRWLSFIPSAIMAAIIASELLSKPSLTSTGLSLSLIAAFAATASGIITRSLFVTVLTGMAVFSGLRYWYGMG
ncbi:AzlD domain-containing protein [Kosakonia sacchari]|uniref:Branched-chain amino acid transport protein n=1 Tax=Kosakonia sacchari TaxID=1158459 RepID=A0A1G4XD12_9ENTR|nr:AzlD domain-containing protein [Kosakonia sacchari]ANR77837.1 branched-chain amino acid ABC transporter [Kosakonia sacchari]MDN2484687.1 AzlD domain-containing protein [Kosakonia sacchari]NUL35537.1 AzlD domain-containing protein [Kosakonia sacchari]SCX39173.1 Branched-chain amino acid transport protein [Kosakonia sacchari]